MNQDAEATSADLGELQQCREEDTSNESESLSENDDDMIRLLRFDWYQHYLLRRASLKADRQESFPAWLTRIIDQGERARARAYGDALFVDDLQRTPRSRPALCPLDTSRLPRRRVAVVCQPVRV